MDAVRVRNTFIDDFEDNVPSLDPLSECRTTTAPTTKKEREDAERRRDSSEAYMKHGFERQATPDWSEPATEWKSSPSVADTTMNTSGMVSPTPTSSPGSADLCSSPGEAPFSATRATPDSSATYNHGGITVAWQASPLAAPPTPSMVFAWLLNFIRISQQQLVPMPAPHERSASQQTIVLDAMLPTPQAGQHHQQQQHQQQQPMRVLDLFHVLGLDPDVEQPLQPTRLSFD